MRKLLFTLLILSSCTAPAPAAPPPWSPAEATYMLEAKTALADLHSAYWDLWAILPATSRPGKEFNAALDEANGVWRKAVALPTPPATLAPLAVLVETARSACEPVALSLTPESLLSLRTDKCTEAMRTFDMEYARIVAARGTYPDISK